MSDSFPQFGLSSLSWLMARWKEPIARMANAEMDRRGHFWEQRFGARELIGEGSLVLCMHYVDMNQIKAGQAPTLEESNHSAIQTRSQAWLRREAEASWKKFHREGSSEGCEQYELSVSDVERLLEESWLAPIRPDGPILLAREAPSLPAACAELSGPRSPTAQDASSGEEPAPAPRPEQAGGEAAAAGPEPNQADEDEVEEEAKSAAEAGSVCSVAASPEAGSAEPRDASSDSCGQSEAATQAGESAAAESARSPAARSPPGRRRGGGRVKRPPPRTIHRRLEPQRKRRASDHAFLARSLVDYFRTLYEKLADLEASRAEGAADDRGARAGPGERSGGPAAQTMSEATARFLREAGLKSERYFEALDRLGEDFHGAIGPAEEVQKLAQKNGRRWMHGIRRCRDVFT